MMIVINTFHFALGLAALAPTLTLTTPATTPTTIPTPLLLQPLLLQLVLLPLPLLLPLLRIVGGGLWVSGHLASAAIRLGFLAVSTIAQENRTGVANGQGPNRQAHDLGFRV